MIHRKISPISKINAFRLSITTSITLSLIMVLGYVYNKNFSLPDEYSLIHIFLSNFIMTYLLFLFSFKIIQKKWRKGTKAFTIIFGSFFIMSVLSFLFSESAFKLVHRNDIPISILIILNLIKDSIVVIIVLLTTALLNSLNERQMAQLENERLIAENIRIRYEVLKNQVDPHFLFNSLNTLDGLIAMNQDKAHEYVQNLSSVFRYAIGNKEVLHLNEELEFTESYA
ncbi:MAG TPA: histidine kinase, partial [Bacteroidales bacterium]